MQTTLWYKSDSNKRTSDLRHEGAVDPHSELLAPVDSLMISLCSRIVLDVPGWS